MLLTKAKVRGEDHGRGPSGFSLLVSPGAGSLLMWGLSWCEVSPGMGPPGGGSPNVVNYNDGVSNVKPS